MRRFTKYFTMCLIAGALTTQFVEAQTQSEYSYTEAFAPNFYTTFGNEYRSASGKPGPQYWQNAASYDIKATLDDQADKVRGTLTMTYTNNSPETLDFVWFQLDQNLFNSKSRGQATIPLSQSRYGNAASTFEGGYQLTNIKVNNTATSDYIISDTRMRINLPK